LKNSENPTEKPATAIDIINFMSGTCSWAMPSCQLPRATVWAFAALSARQNALTDYGEAAFVYSEYSQANLCPGLAAWTIIFMPGWRIVRGSLF